MDDDDPVPIWKVAFNIPGKDLVPPQEGPPEVYCNNIDTAIAQAISRLPQNPVVVRKLGDGADVFAFGKRLAIVRRWQ